MLLASRLQTEENSEKNVTGKGKEFCLADRVKGRLLTKLIFDPINFESTKPCRDILDKAARSSGHLPTIRK
jgi:hypothetical protein